MFFEILETVIIAVKWLLFVMYVDYIILLSLFNYATVMAPIYNNNLKYFKSCVWLRWMVVALNYYCFMDSVNLAVK